MKKKILSIALILGMMLSVLSITPVGASDITVANELPYFFNDFEDGALLFTNGTIVEDNQVNGNDVMQVTSVYLNDKEPYSAPTIKNKTGGNFSGTVPAGATMKMTFWVKPLTEVSKLDFHLVSYDNGIGDCANNSVYNPSTSQWHKITLTYTPSVDKSFNSMYCRAYFEGTYLVDDVEIALYEKGLIKTDKYANLSDYYVGFESGKGTVRLLINNVGYPRVSETVTTNGNETFQIVTDPASGTGKVMKLDLSDIQSGDGSIQLTSEMPSTNKYPAAVKGTVPAGGTIIYTFRYYFPQEMATDNNPAFCMHHSTGGIFAEGSDFATTANEWHTATLTWTNNTAGDVDLTVGTFRMCAPNAPGRSFKVATLDTGETKYGARTIYFDDFTAKITVPGTVEEPDAQAPATSALEMSGIFASGSKVTFTQNFIAQNSEATDESIVKLMNTVGGLTRTVAYAKIGEEMTVPALPEEGTLSFCVVPVDSDNLVGEAVYYTYVEVVGFVASMELSDFAADGSVTAKVNMENMKRNQEGVNAVLVVLMYDADGAMVNYDAKGIVCPYNTVISGETAEGMLTVTADSEAATAEAYLWDCGTSALPTFKNTTMKELVSDITVAK